jgi:hypothetical protein
MSEKVQLIKAVKQIRGGFEWELIEDGAIRVLDAAKSPSGRLYAAVRVLRSPDTLGEELIAASRLDMGDSLDRYHLARDIAAHNGRDAAPWQEALTAIYGALDEKLSDKDAETLKPMTLVGRLEPPAPRQVVEGLVYGDFLNECYGDNDAGKSTTLDYMAYCISTGKPFLGHKVIRGPTVKLDWELDDNITLWRGYRILRGMKLKAMPDNFFYQSLSRDLDYHYSGLVEMVARTKPLMVFIDSMGPAMGGNPLDHERSSP